MKYSGRPFRFVMFALCATAAVPASAHGEVKVKTFRWSVVDPAAGEVVGRIAAPVNSTTSVNLRSFDSSEVEIRSTLPRFRVFRGRKAITRAAVKKQGEYSVQVKLNPGHYTAGMSPTITRLSRRAGRSLPITVEGESVQASPTPVSNPSPTPASSSPSIPKSPAPYLAAQSAWESQMLSYGRKYCDRASILSLSTWEGNIWYYDGIKVYQQIADYTGDTSWLACAGYVKEVYRPYVLNSGGRVGGWRVFPHGLLNDYRRNGDSASRSAVVQLSTNSPFAQQGGGADAELSRETAYLINAFVAAADLGAPQSGLLEKSVNYALGHLTAWRTGGTGYVKPFMAALTMEALIGYAERTGDQRILPAVRSYADWMWGNLWNPSTQSFPYIYCRHSGASTECGSNDNTGSADLNLLIAPAYGWLYQKTGDAKYRTAGDAIFSGGVGGGWLGNGKQFSQNYRWSFDYIRWRKG